MVKYVLKRIGLMILSLFIIMTILFIIIRLMPYVEPTALGADPLHAQQIREALGYDKPILIQYGIFLKGLFTSFDWGVSMQIEWLEPVTNMVFRRLPSTMYVNLFSIFISIPIGLALGIYAALKKNKWQDHLISILVMITISVPGFVIAFGLQYFFAYQWAIFPLEMVSTDLFGWFSWTTIQSILLPVFALSFGSIAGFTRYTRAELTEVLTSDFLLLARAKGLSRSQATMRHALRNSMVPIFPMIVGEFIGILGGSMIIESIFSIPGIGRLYLQAINKNDYETFLFLSMFYVAIGLVAGLLVDISYGFVDPRIRMGGGKS